MACARISIIFICGLAGGCDRMGGSRSSQLMEDADSKSAQGDFARAIDLYEAALDDSPRCAEVHYKLALLYDDKLNDPVSALHHFKRYLALTPNGPCLAIPLSPDQKRRSCAMKTLICGNSLKRVPHHYESARRNRRRKTQAQKKMRRRRVTAAMLCSRATLCSLFRENFISHPSIGKRFAMRTKKISATRRNLRPDRL